jgi:protein gp37
MSDKTGIEWTDATWNPVTGCTEVSPGCDHCYAKTFAERWRGTEGHYFEHGFDVQLRPDKLDQPLRWKRPRKIFVNSMSDLFHDQVPDHFIAQVFSVMACTPRHTFQVLTKRHARMRALLSADSFRAAVHAQVRERWSQEAALQVWTRGWPLSNVWLGVSAENQQWADIRVPSLLDTPAAVRFISAEPLLGPIDLMSVPPLVGGVPAIDWLIVGGESGRGARPMHPDWARSLRDQCQAAGVAFLFKQWGEWAPGNHRDPTLDGQVSISYRPDCPDQHPLGWVRRVGKRRAGRELDGRTWDEYPAAAS